MKISQRIERLAQQARRRIVLVMLAGVTLMTASGCTHLMMMARGSRVSPPTASEFGLGPRVSAAHHYTVTLQPATPLRTRQMQTVRVSITDAEGRAVDGAVIGIDGGMPQHGHGLPTRPQVTQNLGDGLYEIEGVRFNMGGWWELTLAIDGAAGLDTVTFNLKL